MGLSQEDPVILKGGFKLPTVNAAALKPCVDWTYHSAEDFTSKCIAGRASGYISGIAGVGKSWTMLVLPEALEEQGVWVKKLANR